MAAKYRRIDPRIWTDEVFANLEALEKLVTLELLTGQSNRIGIFRVSEALGSEHCGVSHESYSKGLAKCIETFRWSFDKDVQVLFMPSWWRYNKPPNPNVFKGCLDDLHDLPRTNLIDDFLSNYEYLPNGCRKLLETFMKVQRNIKHSDPQQEQEQEQDDEDPLTPTSGGPDSNVSVQESGAKNPRARGANPRAVAETKAKQDEKNERLRRVELIATIQKHTKTQKHENKLADGTEIDGYGVWEPDQGMKLWNAVTTERLEEIYSELESATTKTKSDKTEA